MVGDKVAGIAVHIGARVATAAQPGEVIVSITVKDLMSGSGQRFEDRGVQTLRGLPEPWRSRLRLNPLWIETLPGVRPPAR
jgi:class 3 adenylate cyclase